MRKLKKVAEDVVLATSLQTVMLQKSRVMNLRQVIPVMTMTLTYNMLEPAGLIRQQGHLIRVSIFVALLSFSLHVNDSSCVLSISFDLAFVCF